MTETALAPSQTLLTLAEQCDSVKAKLSDDGLSTLGKLNQAAWLGEMMASHGDTIRTALAEKDAEITLTKTQRETLRQDGHLLITRACRAEARAAKLQEVLAEARSVVHDFSAVMHRPDSRDPDCAVCNLLSKIERALSGGTG